MTQEVQVPTTGRAAQQFANRFDNVAQLPLWPEPKRGTPNSFLRSALFAAVHGQSRRWMEGEVLASLNGLRVVYTGHQLIQSDLDVWENLAHLARLHPLGHECHFTAYALLQLMGRHTGRSEHRWVHKSITRQVACALEISDGRKTYCGSLVHSFRKDEMSGAYIVQLNPELMKLFGDNEWTALEWKQRHAMLKQPLAQALHAFWSTHTHPKPIGVPLLYKITGTRTKQLRDFRRQLRIALAVLKDVGFLDSWEIDPATDVVRVRRAPRFSVLPTA